MGIYKTYVPTPKGLKLDQSYRNCREGNFSDIHNVLKQWNITVSELLYILRRDKKTDKDIAGQLFSHYEISKTSLDVKMLLHNADSHDENYIVTMLQEIALAIDYKIPREELLSFQNKFAFDLQKVYNTLYEDR